MMRRRHRRRCDRRQVRRGAAGDLARVIRLERCRRVRGGGDLRQREVLADGQVVVAGDRIGLRDDVPVGRVAVHRLGDAAQRIATLHDIPTRARTRVIERRDLGQDIERTAFIEVRDLLA
jgi:hypothetical protein